MKTLMVICLLIMGMQVYADPPGVATDLDEELNATLENELDESGKHFRNPMRGIGFGGKNKDKPVKSATAEGNFGKINLKKLDKTPTKAVLQLLKKHKKRMNYFKKLEIRIMDESLYAEDSDRFFNTGSNTGTVAFEQVIEGVVIDNTIGSMDYRSDGTVYYFHSTLIDPKYIEIPDINATKASAETIALQLIETELGILLYDTKYRSVLRHDINKEIVYWQVSIYKEDTGMWQNPDYGVNVNATTSEAESFATSITLFFSPTVCKQVNSVGRCFSEYTEIVWKNGKCVDASKCQYSSYKTAQDNLVNYINWAKANSEAGYCCAENVDIMLDRTGKTTFPYYDTGRFVIKFPKISSNDTSVIKSGVSSIHSREILVHEYTHHQIIMNNPSIQGRINTDPFVRVMLEGFSDVAASIYEESLCAGDADCISKAWIMGDGVMAKQRDLKIERKFSDLSKLIGSHTQSMVVSNIFYRLRKEGASLKDLNKILMRTMKDIRPGLDDGLFDLESIKIQIDKQANGKSTLEKIIARVWAVMENIQIPAAPVNISSFVYACTPATTYYVVNNYSSPGATSYKVYWKNALLGGSWKLLISLKQPYFFSWVSFAVKLKVKACNAAGCSARSTSSTTLVHTGGLVCGGF